MRKNLNKFLALLLALVLCVGGFSNTGHAEAAVLTDTTQMVVSDSGQQNNIQDGVTLHCWNWSYKNIEANMARIASLGYTAIQTSPIQQSKEGTSTYSMDSWWLLYQPRGFHIDNTGSGLGTEAEFTSMCNAAHRYGVKVIVDVVANHLGNQTSNNLSTAISDDIRNDSNCWHDYTKNTTNYNSRYEVTQYCMSGLPDLNTGSTKIQNYVIGFLKDCIDAGADGFRFDAAKHIEVPTDTDNCASNFWPNVINTVTSYAEDARGIDLYCYGELLDSPGGGVPSSAYTTYMSITDNSWGNTLRGNINGGNSYSYSHVYHKGDDVLANKLVLWAESHDTFAGGESKNVSQQNINKTWALVAARADAMGLYFARPGSTNLNNTPMGTASVTGWANAEVAAVNKFHNAFVGQTEYISNEGTISYCERGTSGVVLVNCSGTNKSVSVTAHTMAAGTYKDQITGKTFTVANGKITGNIGETGIAVVYNTSGTTPTPNTPATKNVAYIELPSSWGSIVHCYAYDDSGVSTVDNGEWPGVAMTKVSGRLYKYEVPSNIANPKVIFYSSDANRYPADLEPGLALYGSMIYKNGQWTLYDDGSTTPTIPTPTTPDNDNQNTNPTTSAGSNITPTPTPTTAPNPTTANNNNQKPDPTTADKNNQKPDPTSADKNNQKPDSTTANKDNQKPDSTTTDKNNENPDSTVKDDEENPTTNENPAESLPEETQPDETDGQTNTTDNEEESSPYNEETSSSPSSDNNTPSEKKFPWPAVVIPIVLLGAGTGIYVFIKKRK